MVDHARVFLTPFPPRPPSPLRFFETFSYLPPLDDAAVARQVDYITRNGWGTW